jgi:hypothetical protein
VSIPAHIEQRAEQIVQEHDRQINERNATMTTRQKGRAVPPKRMLLPMPTHNLTLPDGRILTYRAADIPGWLRQQMTQASPETLANMSAWHVWLTDGLRVFATHDTTPRRGPLLHVSISTPLDQEPPTWEEIQAIRAAFYPPDRDAMMVLPREEDYVNVHANTFHLWETPEDWRII